MPPHRTQSTWKVTTPSSHCNQLVWTAPVAPTYVDESTAFITEVDFDDGPPPLVDIPATPSYPPPGEFILFPPAEETKPKRRKASHSKKKPDDHIPRPPNAFILFRSSFIRGQHVSTAVETNHSTLSKIIGITWRTMSESEREVWRAKAKIALAEHEKKYPLYAFKPQQGRKGGKKRKVREVEPKDHERCEQIAKLLVKGKKGKSLEAEIIDFDKHHVPVIVTRFEAPITEHSFKRSSSAPIPETELAIEQQQFFPTPRTPTKRKTRAKSAQPKRSISPAQIPVQPASLKLETGFDFSEFSLENNTAPASYAYEPLQQLQSVDPINTTPFSNAGFVPDLTIDTTFASSWSQCSSPVSPDALDFVATPLGSPSFCTVDPFTHAMDKGFDDYSQGLGFPVFHQQPFGHGGDDGGFLGISGADDFTTHFASVDPAIGQLGHMNVNMNVNVNMDFSYMNALPQFAF